MARKHLQLSTRGGERTWSRLKWCRGTSPAPNYCVHEVVRFEDATLFHFMRRLERECPDLRVLIQKSGAKPTKSQRSPSSRLVREDKLGITLVEFEGRSCVIPVRYQVHHSFGPILRDPRVTFARRYTHNAGHCRRDSIHQAEVNFRGPLPGSLDLDSWGVFFLKRYNPEPL